MRSVDLIAYAYNVNNLLLALITLAVFCVELPAKQVQDDHHDACKNKLFDFVR